jgi:hypothetical protein
MDPIAGTDVGEHLSCVIRPAIEHCWYQPEHLEVRIGEVTYVLERLEQLSHPSM